MSKKRRLENIGMIALIGIRQMLALIAAPGQYV
jgi:hypothetical protein